MGMSALCISGAAAKEVPPRKGEAMKKTKRVFIVTTLAGNPHYGFMEATEKIAKNRAEEVFGCHDEPCPCGCGKKGLGFRVVRATLSWEIKP